MSEAVQNRLASLLLFLLAGAFLAFCGWSTDLPLTPNRAFGAGMLYALLLLGFCAGSKSLDATLVAGPLTFGMFAAANAFVGEFDAVFFFSAGVTLFLSVVLAVDTVEKWEAGYERVGSRYRYG